MNKVINDLIKDIKATAKPSIISIVAAEQLLGDMVYRIHNEGKNASGGQIAATYSTEPIYVSLTGFIRQTNGKGKKVRGRGKYSDSPTFKNGKPRKSRYFNLGYKEFQQEQTGNTDVNLVLTGQLQNDLAIARTGSDWGLSFGDYGLEIYKGLENHYNAIIWFPTKEERENMIVAIEDYIAKKINK